jgi:1-acyl-sn-glycerol-3-phosphate acyltransferase
MLEKLAAAVITGGARLLTGVLARWIGCEPSGSQRIYFVNHTSHLDFVLLWSALPPGLRAKTRPVAAEDYWSANALRRHLTRRVFRSVLVERTWSDRLVSPIAPMLEALDRGESLVLFPEGTRGTGTELLPFKAGMFHVARERPCVELVPVWMDRSHRRVTFGPPAHIEPNEEKAAFLERLRDELLGLKTK